MIFLMSHRNSVWCIAWPIIVAFLPIGRARAPQVTDLYRLRDSLWKGGSDDNLNPNVSDIDSEMLDSLEIGYRAVYPGLSYEATAFMMQKENYHFRDAGDNYVANGETDHMGVELSLDWMLTRDWSIASQLTYAQHEYAFNNNVTGANSAETITDGNTVDGAPETLANTRLRYKYNERTHINVDWEHVGSYFMDASNSTEYDGHNIFAVTADYVLSGQSRLSLRIDNLLDEEYAKRADKWFGKNRYFPGEGQRFHGSHQPRFLTLAAKADRTTDACAAHTAIAIGVFAQILLVVILGVIKCRRVDNLCRDVAISGGAQFVLEHIAAFFGRRFLRRIHTVNAGAILRADIVALSHALRRVVVFPKNLQNFVNGNQLRVKHHLHHFIMAGLAAAYFFIAWIGRKTRRIADLR